MIGFLINPETFLINETSPGHKHLDSSLHPPPQVTNALIQLATKASIDFEVFPKNPLHAPVAILRDQFQMHSEQ